MKVSLGIIDFHNKKYAMGYDPYSLPIDELLHKIGTQLGAVEGVEYFGPKYDGVVVVKVVSCFKHPDADKLSVCRIDDGGVVKGVDRGEDGLVQIVCGAPNVRAGITVAWLPPKTTVPSTVDKDPFVLEVRPIRGQNSNGMLASSAELGISDDHGGILEIKAEDVGEELCVPGTEFKKLYGLDDVVIDMENKMFTHRPDCFGILGVARELAGITGHNFKSPDWYVKENGISSNHDESIKGLSVDVQIPELCPRYMAVIMSDIKVGPSPIWLQAYLSRVGLRSINNIVDMTNYMMMLTGQPLHAFDFDKVAKEGVAKIVVRKPVKGEQMTLLDGKTITPRADAILICDDQKPIALGGLMGGGNSEIDQNTTRIIIESANFDMYNVRRTSMEHGIFTDAVTRFTKGQSEWQCAPVLYKAVEAVEQFSPGAKVIGHPVDFHKSSRQNKPVEVSTDFINARLGSDLAAEDMKKLLENVEFEVMIKTVEASEKLRVSAPFWRTDIEIPEDLVEEIGRLYGYDKLPLNLPKRGIKPSHPNKVIETKQHIRGILSRCGANELLTYSFVHGKLLDRVGQDKDQAFQLSNALSPELQYYRLSLTPSLLDKVAPNLRSDLVRGNDNEFAIFEIGKGHQKGVNDPVETDLPNEEQLLALVFAADPKTAARKYSGPAYYQASKYLTTVLHELGQGFSLEPLSVQDLNGQTQQIGAVFEPSRTAVVSIAGKPVGFVGEYKASVRAALKLPEYSAGFEIAIDHFVTASNSTYVPLPSFPKVVQDISLRVPSDLSYGELFDFVWQEIGKVQPVDTLPTLGPIDIYQDEKDPSHKNITLRLWLSAYNRTLTAEEVNTLLDKVALEAKNKFSAERVVSKLV